MLELIGQTLGPYRIEQRINEGTMATVFRAYQPTLQRYVAIKVLSPTFASQDPKFIKRFQREANLIAQLDHPHIVPVYDFGTEGHYSYIAMRYISGGFTLKRILRHPLDYGQAFNLISQLAAALDYAHQQGIIHRDVKPSNVLMDGNWLLLSDFGLAKFSQMATQLTEQGTKLGTPAYMSPEQLQARHIDHRTDIYALGLILYQMLTGIIPHQADTYWAIALKRCRKPVLPPRALNPTIPESIEQVILRTLAINPADRYDSAANLMAALQRALQDDSYREPLLTMAKVGSTSVYPAPALLDDSEESLPPSENELSETIASPRKNGPAWFGWSNPLWLVGGVMIATGGVIWGGYVSAQATPSPTHPRATTVVITTPTPSYSPILTRTPTPSPTNTTAPLTPTPSPSITSAPTQTPQLPSATSSVTPTPTPTIPTAIATATSTLTPNLPTGKFMLLNPISLDKPSYGPTDFEWEWVGPIPPQFGFEVRVWREGEFPAGAHNAVEDNTSGRIESIGENKYRLTLNIRDAVGVQGRQGEYWWTVALVQISPNYGDLGQQAEPVLFRFEPGGSSSSEKDDSSKSGFIN